MFLVAKKESENKRLPSKWTPLASLVFSLLHSTLQATFFKLIIYCLSSSAFIFLTTLFFSKQLGSGLSPQNCLYFQDFFYLMVA